MGLPCQPHTEACGMIFVLVPRELGVSVSAVCLRDIDLSSCPLNTTVVSLEFNTLTRCIWAAMATCRFS